jgi:hypothetical protein
LPPVPSPINSLLEGQSILCPNFFIKTPNAAWDLVTFGDTWSTQCTEPLITQTLNFGAPPTLVALGKATVSVTVSPLPGSSAPIVFSSVTSTRCTVDASSGLVTALAAALPGDICTISADKAGDATHEAAAQIQQNLVLIAAPENGVCGIAEGRATRVAPNAQLCSVGAASAVTTTSWQFSWVCAGANGGVDASCSAARTYEVTPLIGGAGIGGVVSPPTPQTIVANERAVFSITANDGYVITGIGGTCGGDFDRLGIYTTAPIATGDCTVTATFAPHAQANNAVVVTTMKESTMYTLVFGLLLLAMFHNRLCRRATAAVASIVVPTGIFCTLLFASGPLFAQQFASVSAGSTHTCIRSLSNQVFCWGQGRYGQLGLGNFNSRDTPPPTATLTQAIGVTAGSAHSCAWFNDGKVNCWGIARRLGDGTFLDDRATPGEVTAMTSATQVAAGSSHTCARLAGGQVQCWGAGSSGQLGNGGNSDALTPVTVTGISTATAVDAGDSFSCALLSNSNIRCWGDGGVGQLGNGSNASSNTSVPVTGISSATQISLGRRHACALLADQSVRCWGFGTSGQLGDGNTSNSNVPITVQGLGSAIAVAAGGDNSCAILTGGSVRCWGAGNSGQLGNGARASVAVPTAVHGVHNATALTLGFAHGCALLAGGGLRCWGSNVSGQLGNGYAPVDSLVPQMTQTNCTLDLDGDGVVSPMTDGLLLARALLGFSGTLVTDNAVSDKAERNSWSSIRAHLATRCGLPEIAP